MYAKIRGGYRISESGRGVGGSVFPPPMKGRTICQVKIVPAENVRPVQETLAASDWSVVIISTLPFSLSGSRGEYLRVFGIHSDG